MGSHFSIPPCKNGTALDAPHFRQVDTISSFRLPTVFNEYLNSCEARNSISIFCCNDDEALRKERYLVEVIGESYLSAKSGGMDLFVRCDKNAADMLGQIVGSPGKG